MTGKELVEGVLVQPVHHLGKLIRIGTAPRKISTVRPAEHADRGLPAILDHFVLLFADAADQLGLTGSPRVCLGNELEFGVVPARTTQCECPVTDGQLREYC
jgi:hypothetical protein